MRVKDLILISNGLAILELIVGNIVSTFGFGYQYVYLGLHAIIGILLFSFTIYSYFKVEERFIKRIIIGTLALIVLGAVLGIIYIVYDNVIVSIIHFILSLGVLSNLSIAYGFFIGKEYK
jgi:hypothetical protein